MDGVRSESEEIKKLIDWAEFHQAVASALKVKPGKAPGQNRILFCSLCCLDATYTQRFEDCSEYLPAPSHTQAGYWFAAGLQSQLTESHIPEITALLGMQHPLTQISVVLGLSISLRGSQDSEAERMAFLHLPHYHPKSFPEADWCPASVQTAMLLSIGFLKANSGDHTATKRMLDELGRHPGVRPPNIRSK